MRIKFLLLFVLVVLLLFHAGCGLGLPEMDLGDIEIVWRDNEKGTYNFLNNDEMQGTVEISIERAGDNYNIGTVMNIRGGEITTGAVVRASDMQPLSNYFTNNPGPGAPPWVNPSRYTGQYGERLLTRTQFLGEEQHVVTGRMPEAVIDDDVLLMVIRNMPLAVGYEKDIIVSDLMADPEPSVRPYRVRVVGIETVTVPKGEFEVYRVTITYTGRAREGVPVLFAWYTTDEDRIMVKHQNRFVIYELTDWQAR